MARCNPYGYATDAGPKHLMGGFYGPEYAGRQTTERDGIHGPAICERPADRRVRLVCQFGHTGPIMDICGWHAYVIADPTSTNYQLATCTRCVWPDVARGIDQSIDWLIAERGESLMAGDKARAAKLTSAIEDHGHQMTELRARGLTPNIPLMMIEVS
jgi:hypothetical protein